MYLERLERVSGATATLPAGSSRRETVLPLRATSPLTRFPFITALSSSKTGKLNSLAHCQWQVRLHSSMDRATAF